MRCPFLREAQVKFCRASAFRKFIVRLPGQPDNERCSSPAYVDCSAAKQHIEERPSVDHCPFLHESLVQYCSAASVPKYIPYSESELSQCTTASHKYCRLFAELEHPNIPVAPGAEAHAGCRDQDNSSGDTVEGISVPGWLWYSSNHMWLDVGPDGVFHIGIDAFLAKALGSIERLTFMTVKGIQRPTVVFSVRGVDLQMMFPNEICIGKTNMYLRTNPSKILSDPYSFGWLFEGKKANAGNNKQVTEGLISGKEAMDWMKHEAKKMTTIAHELSEHPDASGTVCMADGGVLQSGLFQHIDHEGILRIFNEFFSPYAARRDVSI